MTPDQITCSSCGSVYKLLRRKVPMRDKDSINCRCGTEIWSWNGGVMFNVELIKPGQSTAAPAPTKKP